MKLLEEILIPEIEKYKSKRESIEHMINTHEKILRNLQHDLFDNNNKINQLQKHLQEQKKHSN